MNPTAKSSSLLAILLAARSFGSWTALDTVLAHSDFAFRRDTAVVMDYDLVPDTLAYLKLHPVDGRASRVALQTPPGTYYLDFDVANGRLWVQALGTAPQYVLTHQFLDGRGRTSVGVSTKYRESIRAGGDRAVWIDYRHVANQAPYNSEVYTTVAPGFVETRITTDAAYQAKARTNGVHVAWLEYDATRTRANVVLHDTRTGISRKVAEGSWHQDNPWITDSLLVWTDYRTNPAQADIWSLDLATGQTRAVCTASGHQDKPAARGKDVVWEDYRTGAAADIRAWSNAMGAEIEVSKTTGHSTLPRIDGSRIAWFEENSILAVAVADLLGPTSVSRPARTANPLQRSRSGWILDLPPTWKEAASLQIGWRDARGVWSTARWTRLGDRIELSDAPPSAQFLEVRSQNGRLLRAVPGALR